MERKYGNELYIIILLGNIYNNMHGCGEQNSFFQGCGVSQSGKRYYGEKPYVSGK